MFKLYKWLVYIIIRPYKKLQHFRNWFAIYLASPKQVAEEKQKEKQKTESSPLTLGPRPNLPPRSPSPPGFCRLPQAGARTGAWRPCRRRRHLAACLEALSPLLDAPGDAQLAPGSIPPLHSFLPFLPWSISSPPETPPEHLAVEDAATVS